MTDAYAPLHDLLNEMQRELGNPQWTSKPYDRIEMALNFRAKMWDAICAYRDEYAPTTKVPS